MPCRQRCTAPPFASLSQKSVRLGRRTAVAAHLVHHVQRKHHRHVQLHELQRQIQIAFDVRRIGDVDDAGRLFGQDEPAGHALLVGVRRERVNARQVGDFGVRMSLDRAALAVDGHAGEVADVLIGAGQLIEQRRLAAVLVPRERKGQLRALFERGFGLLDVEASFLAETGVLALDLRQRLLPNGRRVGRLDFDVRGVVKPQGQFIAVNAQLHRVAHRGELHQRDCRAGDHAHIQKVLPQRAFAADDLHNRASARLEFPECHQCLRLPTDIVCADYNAYGKRMQYKKEIAADLFVQQSPFGFDTASVAGGRGRHLARRGRCGRFDRCDRLRRCRCGGRCRRRGRRGACGSRRPLGRHRRAAAHRAGAAGRKEQQSEQRNQKESFHMRISFRFFSDSLSARDGNIRASLDFFSTFA